VLLVTSECDGLFAVRSTTRAARMESAQVALGDPSIPGSAEMHGEVPAHWNWMKWISKSGEEFKGNWGDWRFFDLEGKVTKHFRGKVHSIKEDSSNHSSDL
jgi:hypothetical protein